MPHITILAGGTGGHIYPGLAVAKELQQRGYTVSWLGSMHGLENEIVPKNNIELDRIAVKGLRGKGLTGWIKLPFRMFKAIRAAKKILKQRKTDLVIGFGGYVAGPGGMAAKQLGIPLVIHEQNAIFGMTNKILARFAKKVFSAFELNHPKIKTTVIGNPVRKEIADAGKLTREFPSDRPLHLLVIGGSQGALALNQTVPEALKLLDQKVEVRHQAGKATLEKAKEAYQDYITSVCDDTERHPRAGGDLEKPMQELDSRLRGNDENKTIIKHDVTATPYIEDMAEAYAWADLIICRAGALTVSEVAASNTPAIFIPHPHVVDDHQRLNAMSLVKHDAAICITQAELTAEKLAHEINKVAHKRGLLFEMSKELKSHAKTDAAFELCEMAIELLL